MDPLINSMDMTDYNLRLSDIADEPKKLLLPIEGYEQKPLVTLEEAIKPISDLVQNIDQKVYVAKENCQYPRGKLTSDLAGAIMLYTIGEKSSDAKPFYYILNSILRSDQPDRTDQLQPWFSYLKLFITALSCIPSYRGTVYRGVKLNLSEYYPEGRRFVWWAFSSCTKSLGILQSELFLGQNGPGTLFVIECFSGKEIRQYSYFDREDEVLLVAARQFVVVSRLSPRPDLWIIQIKEIEPPFPFLKTDDSISSTFETSVFSDTNQVSAANICAQCLKNMSGSLTSDDNTIQENLPNISQSESTNVSKDENSDNSVLLSAINPDQSDDKTHTPKLVNNDSDASYPPILINSESSSSFPLENNEITETIPERTTIAHPPISNMNNLNPEVAAEPITHSAPTKVMRFENTLITEDRAILISDAIRQNSVLEILYVCNNSLKDEALRYILDAITDRSSLKLFIRDNKITDIGVTYINNILSTTPTAIFMLYLDKNRITNEGVKSILQTLSNTPNSGLETLDFSGNLLINDECIDDMILLLNENRTIRSLYLEKCNLSEDGKNRLRMALEKKIALSIHL